MKTVGIIAMTGIYIVGGIAAAVIYSFNTDAALLFWSIGLVTGILATLASQIEE